jgi:hypothetical protein
MSITRSVIAFTSSRGYIAYRDSKGSGGSAGSGFQTSLASVRDGFGKIAQGTAQFWPERQAQWAPPAPHPPPIGIAAFAVPFDAPTIPGLDKRLTRFEPRHDGHSALRSVVTNASKSRAQSLQLYSKMGIPHSIVDLKSPR